MQTYLLKATLIWTLLLVLYELLYRNRPAFTLNRLYLLSALLAGALFPLLPLTLPGAGSGTGNLAGNLLRPVYPYVLPAVAAPQARVQAGISWQAVVFGIYIAGVLAMAVVSLRGLVYILRTAIYGSFKQMEGFRIFHSNRRPHAPFSFMGWIFIATPEQYSRQELLFVLRHEDVHNRRKHWLDVLLMQLGCTLFWFHPLVWRYRHLLRLVHEYEADRLASGDTAYDYGHFLLQQTLLQGTPAIAHSFHFSPIKNRIAMLTQQRKTQAWKYSFWIPAICAGLLLAAKPADNNERVRVGDKTHFRGHDFYWTPEAFDSVLVEDPTTKEMTTVRVNLGPMIHKMDQDIVYNNDDAAIVKARFNKDGKELFSYAENAFRKQFSDIPDSIRSIAVTNIVIDAEGKIRYYDIQISADGPLYENVRGKSLIADYTRALEKIIDGSPSWQPATAGGKHVKVRIPGGFNVYFKPFGVSPVNR
ncbi:M56 family metallopeptidase [Taibaiella koreensis]|uniref:M56 family metallopeptidase n=1 Tax=Taibaiella koreensis TaxID=1268548 RepID=UPI000E59A4F0|nr:M56 family metallopeptidase [Taibaiella koreensis]